MPKHEPWHKPRKDEEADDALLDWLGGGSKKPPAKKGGGGLCGVMVLAGLASFAAAAAGLARGVLS
jgi:hypothetical protein